MKRLLCSAIAVALLICLSGVARANTIILTLAGAPTPTGPNYTWTYNVELTNGTVNPADLSMLSIWDFDGLVGLPTFTPAFVGPSFLMSTPLTDPVETALFFSAFTAGDDPGMLNIRGDYTGAVITNPTGTPLLLGTVSAVSIYKTFTFDRYISRDTGLSGTDPGTFTTQIQVPRGGGFEFAPLPSTAGLGLVLLGGLGFGRVRRLNLA